VDLARKALAEPLEVFLGALTEAVEQLRTDLSALLDPDQPPDPDRTGLGPFARDRIDPVRFVALLQQREPVDVEAEDRIRRAHDILSSFAASDSPPWMVDVEPGGDLRGAVTRALDGVGRVFAAARLAELSRKGRFDENQHAEVLESVPFSHWTSGERRLAPPLIVEVDGADLRVAGLADLLEGSLRIVLVVRGDAPPAPLARLVSPGTLVLQTVEAAELDPVARWSGPSVAALLPESAARFIHDPARGDALSDRLVAHGLPGDPKAALGEISVNRQVEDLRHLSMLVEAATPATPASPPLADTPAAQAPSAAAAPADHLAAWLLSQANLEEAP
jgi:hypothetical protein